MEKPKAVEDSAKKHRPKTKVLTVEDMNFLLRKKEGLAAFNFDEEGEV
jgi:hypothetical protein